MNCRPARAHRWRRFLALAVLTAFTALLGPVAARADDKTYMLRFSTKSGDPNPGASLLLRPNLEQTFFIYVDDLLEKKGMVKVELRADGKPIDGGTVTLSIPDKQKITPVLFGQKEAAPEKPAAPPGAPATPIKFADLKGTVQVVLLDATTNQVLDKADLKVKEPKDYIAVTTELTFDPKAADGKKNSLSIKLKAKEDTFYGPPCRVELVLDPERIPGLIDNKTSGSRSGTLAAPGAELKLTAEDLDFKTKTDVSGVVYLKIDGWERAFTYTMTFSRKGTSAGGLVGQPVVRLIAPRAWNPAKQLPVTLEADNIDEKEILELGFDRDGDGKFLEANGEIQTFRGGSRQQRLTFNPAFPGGALQLTPEVKDWTAEPDVKDVFGSRDLRVRLLTPDGKLDDKLSAFTKDDKGVEELRKVEELRMTVLLDGNAPAGVKFVNLPKKLPRGEPLPVSATCVDPDLIKEVLFYVGKPGPDGKVPPNAVQAAGQRSDKDKGIWSASLEAPTDQKGKFDVTVQFVKVTGLVTSDTMKIELVDPVKEGPPKASIEGKIVSVDGQAQGAGIPVELRDDKNALKDSTKTDAKSNYIFKDVPAGTYRIFAVRTGTKTKGDTTVSVKEGDKKTDVDVKLSR